MKVDNWPMSLIGKGPNATCIEINNVDASISKVEVSTPTLDELEGCADAKQLRTWEKVTTQVQSLYGNYFLHGHSLAQGFSH
jgi:hypothetical protein